MRRVASYSKNLDEIQKVYNSVLEAAKDIGLSSMAIIDCIEGRCEYTCGSKWRYYNDE